MIGPNDYQCAMCGGVFEKGWTDEEANAERESIFGKSISLAECDVICDDCFKLIDPANNPNLVEQAVADQLRARNSNPRTP